MRRHVTSSLYPTGRSAVCLYNVIGDALRGAFVTHSMQKYRNPDGSNQHIQVPQSAEDNDKAC